MNYDLNKGIIPEETNNVLRGNINAQLLELYEMKDKFSLLLSSSETSKNKLDLAIYCNKTDNMPYISYHRHLCSTLRYALEMQVMLQEFIINAEQYAIFAGLIRGFEYPQAMDYVKSVIDPYWEEHEPEVIDFEESYASYMNEDPYDEDDTIIGPGYFVESWYASEDPWEEMYEGYKQPLTETLTLPHMKEEKRNLILRKEIYEGDKKPLTVEEAVRFYLTKNAEDQEFNFGYNEPRGLDSDK